MDDQELNKQYELSPEIKKALHDLGYDTLTEVQQAVIPLVFAQKDSIVQSQTGSGKTAAFAIPICEKIIIEQKKPQVLVLTPTRELAVQLKQEISNIGRFKRIRCAAVFGRQRMETQRRELQQRVHIVVGTPGRMLDHIERGNISLDEIQYLIIDEADKMLNMGFIEQVDAVIKGLPENRLTLLFSATIPDKIQRICEKHMKDPVKIEIKSKQLAFDAIRQGYYEIEAGNKFGLLTKILYLERPESCIVFCNLRDTVDLLADKLKQKGFLCGTLHGGMEQIDRLDSIRDFKRGRFQFLVATDVAARGLHIDDISLVINYDMPADEESYVHRIGRTGRAGHLGEAVTLVTSHEYKALQAIEKYIDHTIPRLEPPDYEAVETGKQIFAQRAQKAPVLKADISEKLNKQITRLRINAGKKSKMRPGDILGAITAIEGIDAENIGIITIQDTCSYVEILGDKGELVMQALLKSKIKGKIHTIKEVGFFCK